MLFHRLHASSPGSVLKEGFLEEAALKGEGFDCRWLDWGTRAARGRVGDMNHLTQGEGVGK